VAAVALAGLSAGFAALVRVLAEVTDDAFISFRYARHLVDGVGLVFNSGERVEGYTNFLWTLLMAAGYALGADQPLLSQWLGCVLAAVLVVSLVAYSRRSFGGSKASPVDFLAAAFVATHPLFIHNVGNGLETTLFTLLTALAFFSWTRGSSTREVGRFGRPWVTGCLLGASYLTRPDAALWAALFVGVDLLFWLARPQRVGRTLTSPRIRVPLIYSAIFAAIAGAHTAFRLAYYGEFVPNTFYIKVGSNWSWAVVTYSLFGPAMTGLTLGMVAAAPLVLRNRFAVGAALIVSADVLFILRNGGAGGRYAMALLPLVALLLQELVRWGLQRVGALPGRRAAATAAIGASVVALAGATIVHQWEPVRESSRFSRQHLRADRALAACLMQASRPGDAIAVIAAGALPYYADRPVIDMLGLSDRTIAREGNFDPASPLGHQRHDADYVIGRAPRFIHLPSQATGIAAVRTLLEHPTFRSRWVETQLPCAGRQRIFVDRLDPLSPLTPSPAT
jgi:hypothetical protein